MYSVYDRRAKNQFSRVMPIDQTFQEAHGRETFHYSYWLNEDYVII